MARDADGNYYYDAGTVNEQMDNVDVYEDSDGNFGVLVNGQEMRVDELAHVFSGQRGPFEEQELADGEVALYVSDGNGAGTSSAGDLVAATGTATDDNTEIAETVVVASP